VKDRTPTLREIGITKKESANAQVLDESAESNPAEFAQNPVRRQKTSAPQFFSSVMIERKQESPRWALRT